MLQKLSSITMEYLSSMQSNSQQANISNFFGLGSAATFIPSPQLRSRRCFGTRILHEVSHLLHSFFTNATEFLSESFVWFPVQEDIDSALRNLSMKQTKLSVTARDE